MTVKKQFAPDANAVADHMDALLEALAELLEEPQDPAASSTAKQSGAVAIADLSLLHGK